MKRDTVGIFVFDDVEVLDFAGPFEVFSRTRLMPGAESRRTDQSAPFDVFTVARSAAPLVAIGGLTIVPSHYWETAPPIDILVVPVGFDPPATDEEIRAASLQFVRKLSGFNAPSKANERAFNDAIEDVAAIARRLIDALTTASAPKSREEVAAAARARAAERFAR